MRYCNKNERIHERCIHRVIIDELVVVAAGVTKLSFKIVRKTRKIFLTRFSIDFFPFSRLLSDVIYKKGLRRKRASERNF